MKLFLPRPYNGDFQILKPLVREVKKNVFAPQRSGISGEKRKDKIGKFCFGDFFPKAMSISWSEIFSGKIKSRKKFQSYALKKVYSKINIKG